MGKTARKTPAEMLIELKGIEAAPALDALVQRYFAMVYSTCLRITRDRHDAEDAAQASFLCLAVELGKRKVIRTPGPWLYQVACNASVDICRRRKRRLAHETLCARTDPAILAEDPACRADMAEMRPAVLEALNNLPTRYRLPLILQYFGGLSHEQLARELGCTRVSLRVRLHRGHKMLRKTLENRGICLAGGLLGVIIAEAVRSQVSDTLVGTTIALGHQASQAGLQACTAGPEILAVASHAAAPIGRGKLWLLISLIAGGLLAAGAPLLARLTQDWPSFPTPTNFTPPQLPTFTAPIPKFSSADPKTDPAPIQDPPQTEPAQAAAPAATPPAASPQPPSAPSVASAPYTAQPPTSTPPTVRPFPTPALPAPSDRTANQWTPRYPPPSTVAPAQPNRWPEYHTPVPPPPQVAHRQPGELGPEVPPPSSPGRHRPPRPPGRPPRSVQRPDLPDSTGPLAAAVTIESGTASPWRGSVPQPDTDQDHFSTNAISAMSVAFVDSHSDLLGYARVNQHRDFSLANYYTAAGDFITFRPVTYESSLTTRIALTLDGAKTLYSIAAPPQTPTIRHLINNGQVVADGTTESYTSYSEIRNTIDNPVGGFNGWFAMNKGRVNLPPIHLTTGTHTYNWGEDASDNTIDLINSVRLTASSQGTSDLSISLLATDTPSLPTLPAGHHFLSIYAMSGGDTLSGDINVIARYDDTRLTWQHLDETQVKLWYYTDGDWTRVYDGFSRDLQNNWVSGNIPADARYFAVSTPEPASALALLGTGALLLLRRSRRSR